MQFIGWIIIGGLAGWIAEKIMKADHGLLTNIILGVIGAFVGGWVLDFFIANPTGGGAFSWLSLITAVIGAVIVIAIYRLIRGRTVR